MLLKRGMGLDIRLSIGNVFRGIGLVIGKRNYALLALVSAFASGAILYYLTVFNVAFRSISLFIEMNGLLFTYWSISSIMVIAILFGINTALLVFAVKNNISKKKDRVIGLGGILAGGVASGCPTCGSIIFALFAGNPLGLFYFPYWGLELKALSILLLGASIFILASRADKKLCEECE